VANGATRVVSLEEAAQIEPMLSKTFLATSLVCTLVLGCESNLDGGDPSTNGADGTDPNEATGSIGDESGDGDSNGSDQSPAGGTSSGGAEASLGTGGGDSIDPGQDGTGGTIVFPEPEKPQWTVDSLADLRVAIQQDDQSIVMKEGEYNLTELPDNERTLPFSGSNNTVDLVGVYVEVPVGSTAKDSYLTMTGSDNTVIGGVFEDKYTTGLVDVTDYYAYNKERGDLAYGLGGAAVFSVLGNNNLVDGLKLTVRGSFPYGYGSIYGIGSGNTFGLNKRCGIVVKGQNNVLDHVEIQQRAFCHGIYLQAPADNTTIRNSLVEGVMRLSAELYDETETDSLPYRSDYLLPEEDGTPPVPMDVMLPLSEDGIRVYTGGGSATVENCTVKKMRGGIRLYLASEATVTDSTAIDCGATNFNMPRGGTVSGSSGNFAYAPLSDFRLSKSDQDLEITIIPSPHATGPHNLADVLGNNHSLVFHRTPGPIDDDETRAIVVSGNGSTILNETEYRIIVTGSNNDITSAGDVTDNGSNNDVSAIELQL